MRAQPESASAGSHSAWGSLAVSLFIPGLGSVVNRESLRGALYFSGFVAWWGFILSQPFGAYNPLQSIVFLAGMGLYVFQMLDAYRGAKRWNQRHGIKPASE